MKTSTLKKFAQDTRRKLLQQVEAKLEFVLTHDTVELREKAAQIQKLKEELERIGKAALIDKVAYTWFNRLMALRFMDANDFQPSGIRIVSPKDGFSLPQILDEAKQGALDDQTWQAISGNVNDLLDGHIPSRNPQNEAYRYLLIAACNALHRQFPFLFERISDYTELLLPDDLTSEFSIVNDLVEGMSVEDCKEVEIIGWLYQFYISEKNEELIGSKKKYDKNELAPASQLFTPKWIVQYMVDNTLGQLWSEIDPNTKVTENLEFYINPTYKNQLNPRELSSIEEIKFFDPCVGSGHILSYAFDVFYKIYEEQGYNPSEIPGLIISKNLFGVDIDQRAAQLSSFVLLMKGRQKYRRFLRAIEKNDIQPNIAYFQDFEFDNKFKNASALGSLIKVEPNEVKNLKIERNSLFGERQKELKKLYQFLGQQYDVVVTNPPYISSSRMEGSLKQYVEANYPETKSDLFATFILRCLELCSKDGLTGYMTPFVWMFISSYEKLREEIIEKHFINNLIQLEYSGFDGATVPICTFTLRKQYIQESNGSYIRLSNFKGAKAQAPKTIEAIKNNDCGWFYITNQRNFKKVFEYPIAYWASENLLETFSNSENNLGAFVESEGKNVTTNNLKFIRLFWEIDFSKIGGEGKDWFPFAKGGSYRKWYGNNTSVVNWSSEALDHYRTSNAGRLIRPEFWYLPGITWSKITSKKASFRLLLENQTYQEVAILSSSGNKENIYILLGLLNSKYAEKILELLAPTLNYQLKDILRIPFIAPKGRNVVSTVQYLLDNAIQEWDANEKSLDFKKNELIRIKGQDLEETYDLYCHYWENKFYQLHQNEEELNRQFIEIYGLQDEITTDVPLEDITILREETSIENGQLVFNAKEILAQFVSYSVGCMMGRYALDQDGLILANQGETLADFSRKIDKELRDVSFLPDDDAIIPVLDDEWFEDDIVGRFYEFLKVTFGERDFQKNLDFVQEQLGKDIRKYFVKDFYKDHVKRYKKRPIYWMFSSPKGAFNVLVYLHRYTPDTINDILNNYLREFLQKLKSQKAHFEQVQISASTAEKNKATKEIDKLDKMILDCEEYERDILYPLATDRIAIDLDDGVLVNYNKLGKAVKEVKGLNDKKTKEKVRKFDWIDGSEIRD